MLRFHCPLRGSPLNNVPLCAQCVSPRDVLGLQADPSRLGQCKLVACGFGINPDSVTSANDQFFVGNESAVADYVSAGGRLWVNAAPANIFGPPVNWPVKGNTLLAALGVAMRFGTVALDDGSGSVNYTPAYSYVAGTANIAQGITNKISQQAVQVTGGTSCWKLPNPWGTGTDGGKVTIAVEALGSGFVFASGDSSQVGFVGNNPCDFHARTYRYGNAAII